MKKFFALVCAIALCAGFSACTKIGNAKLAGTWNSSTCSWTEDGESGTDDITGELTFVFFEDGDFIVYNHVDNERLEGEYRLNGKKLSMTIDGETETVQIKKLTDTELDIYYEEPDEDYSVLIKFLKETNYEE